MSTMSKKRLATTRRLEKKLAKYRRNLFNWTHSAHYNAINYLLTKFDVIVQPWLHVSRLITRVDRRIGTPTARKLMVWSHFKYRQRLTSAAYRYQGRYVIVSEEPGTSKTCTNCGFWNEDLRINEKIFHCPRCDIHVDRDVAGARNNFLAWYGKAMGVEWDGRDG